MNSFSAAARSPSQDHDEEAGARRWVRASRACDSQPSELRMSQLCKGFKDESELAPPFRRARDMSYAVHATQHIRLLCVRRREILLTGPQCTCRRISVLT